MSIKIEEILEYFNNISNIQNYYIRKSLKKFCKYTSIESEILDIGSGRSPYKYLCHFKTYLSIDIEIRKKANVDILANIVNIPIKENIFDLIICTEVMEHVKDTEKMFMELNRLLKNNGYLILTVPLIIGMHDTIDYYRFTNIALEDILEKFGFDIISIHKRGGIFSSVFGIISQIPNQITDNKNKKNYIYIGLILVCYVILFPFMNICIFLDNIDENKNFTLGYNILAKKQKHLLKNAGLKEGYER